MLNSAETNVEIIAFLMRKYMCIPMKEPVILVSLPLNKPVFLLWNSYDFYFNIEWGLWYIPEPNNLYIALWAVILWSVTVILEKSLKNNDTVC